MSVETGPPGKWTATYQRRPSAGGTKDAHVLTRPTVSKVSSKALNPFTYRTVRSIQSLDDLAALLQSPDDWRDAYARITEDEDIMDAFETFCQLSTNEI